MAFAPVIVFNYNRPDHSLRTWEELGKNLYAHDTELYLYCDGPKMTASEETRRVIDNTQKMAVQYAQKAKETCKFKDVHVVISESNKGLANSIIGGVSDVIEKYGRAIILEDDLLTSRFFLKYMNEALDKYQDRPGVMSVSANRPPIDKMIIPDDYPYDVFVSLRSYSTGWATWKDRWNRVDWSMDYMSDFLNRQEEIAAFNRGGDDMTPLLIMQRDGKIDSWAMRFGYAHFKEHCVAILPCHSYVDNIGFDGTGIHSGKRTDNEYRNDLSLAVENPRFLENIYEDRRIINAFYNRFCNKRRPLYKRLINTIARKLGCAIPFAIKKKVYE